MVDPRFYKVSGPFTLQQLEEFSDSESQDCNLDEGLYNDVAALSIACGNHVSFIDNRKYMGQFEKTRAGVVIVHPDLIDKAPRGVNLLVTRTPYKAYAKVAKAFYPDSVSLKSSGNVEFVSSEAEVGNNVSIDTGVVIKEGAEIGANSIICANTTIERGVVIGNNSWIGPSTTLSYCIIGERAVIHAGVRIGQDGFGFAPSNDVHEKVPQLGRVVIGNDVEIGANTCIDRGASIDTVIGDGTKLDNLVQVGHNVVIGKGCLVAGQAGIAGSVKIGDYVMIGGQAGLSGHISIGSGAKIAAQSGVTKDIPENTSVMGFPAIKVRRFWKNMAMLNRMAARDKG